MKKKLIFLVSMAVCLTIAKGYGQNFAVKSNLLYDATLSFNGGVEFALSDQLTLDISGQYNPWAFPQYVKNIQTGVKTKDHSAYLKHWFIQPELRWWLCEKFNGHFFGAHLHGGAYNFGGLSFLPDGIGDKGIQNHRYNGWFAGGGVSYGYHWILSSRFSLEFTLGAGYAYLKFDRYPCADCGTPESKYLHYFGPTKAGITAIFMLH
ncbi:MAG: DUF3575 domain-containing protein [Tannerella sp.]|jgi:hypothetical protein|nr:DUF3575 domain-containing protein [Tannerella sp.]